MRCKNPDWPTCPLFCPRVIERLQRLYLKNAAMAACSALKSIRSWPIFSSGMPSAAIAPAASAATSLEATIDSPVELTYSIRGVEDCAERNRSARLKRRRVVVIPHGELHLLRELPFLQSLGRKFGVREPQQFKLAFRPRSIGLFVKLHQARELVRQSQGDQQPAQVVQQSTHERSFGIDCLVCETRSDR